MTSVMSESDHKPRIYFVVFLLAALAAYWPIARSLAPTPDDMTLYNSNAGMSIWELLKKYTEISIGWYRPTQFHLVYFFTQKLWGWQQYVLYKLLNIAIYLACAGMLIRYSMAVGFSFQAAWLGAIFFLIQPGNFYPLKEVTSFDGLYQLVAIASGYFYLRALELSRVARTRALIASLILMVFGFTCKEAVLGLGIFLPLAWWLDGRRERSTGAAALAAMTFSVVAALWLKKQLGELTGIYRTVFDPVRIFDNSKQILRLVFRWLKGNPDFTNSGSWIENGIWALLILTFFVYGFHRARRDKDFSRTICISLAWFLSFTLLPLYAGGYSWHFSLAIAGIAPVIGAGAELVARARFKNPKRVVLSAALVAAIWSSLHFDAFLRFGPRSELYRMYEEFLANPPFTKEEVKKASAVGAVDLEKVGPWAFNEIVRFTYQDPGIKYFYTSDPSDPRCCEEKSLCLARDQASRHFSRFSACVPR